MIGVLIVVTVSEVLVLRVIAADNARDLYKDTVTECIVQLRTTCVHSLNRIYKGMQDCEIQVHNRVNYFWRFETLYYSVRRHCHNVSTDCMEHS